ncbi:hypothetical protein ACHAWT_001974 [Skeletonema menzelii]
MTKSSREERVRRLLEDSRDDSSSAGSRENTKPCPFDMPSTKNESKDDDSSRLSSIDAHSNPDVTTPLRTGEEDLSNESEIQLKPLGLEIGTPLSIGEIDSFARVHGIKQLGASSFAVSSIDAHSNPDVVDEWIYDVEERHAILNKDTITALPNVQELMKPWPKEVEDSLNSGEVCLPPADIDMSLEEYSKAMCSLFAIPVEETLVGSIHTMMSLFTEYTDRETSNDISVSSKLFV